MKLYNSVETIKQQAQAMLDQVEALSEMVELDVPGNFIFSPPTSSRLSVSSLEELHAARMVLRERYGWRDRIHNKFFSCGNVIVTYIPDEGVKLPLPFELWIEAPPESFPEKLLGDCKLVRRESAEYNVVCSVERKEEVVL